MDKRDFRPSQEQWKIVVEFLEAHPTMLKPKFRHFDGDNDESKTLWGELSLRLNSMGLGARSTDKWQLAIGRWNSKTKAKASQIRKEMEITGGGPVKSAPLNQIEERLMALLGWKSVTGDRNVEMGLALLVQAVGPTDQALLITEAMPTTSTWTPSLPPLSNLPKQIDSPPPLTPIKNRPAPQPISQPSSGLRGNSTSVRFSTERSRRMATLSQMHREYIQKLTAIEKNTQIMAAALQSISSDFNRFVNRTTQ